MTDHEWYELVKAGEDAGWKLVWEKVVEPESTSLRSAEMMKRYSITAGDLMGMLYEDMLGRRKIDRMPGAEVPSMRRMKLLGLLVSYSKNSEAILLAKSKRCVSSSLPSITK